MVLSWGACFELSKQNYIDVSLFVTPLQGKLIKNKLNKLGGKTVSFYRPSIFVAY